MLPPPPEILRSARQCVRKSRGYGAAADVCCGRPTFPVVGDRMRAPRAGPHRVPPFPSFRLTVWRKAKQKKNKLQARVRLVIRLSRMVERMIKDHPRVKAAREARRKMDTPLCFEKITIPALA
eukprot:gene9551-biopygen15260